MIPLLPHHIPQAMADIAYFLTRRDCAESLEAAAALMAAVVEARGRAPALSLERQQSAD